MQAAVESRGRRQGRQPLNNFFVVDSVPVKVLSPMEHLVQHSSTLLKTWSQHVPTIMFVGMHQIRIHQHHPRFPIQIQIHPNVFQNPCRPARLSGSPTHHMDLQDIPFNQPIFAIFMDQAARKEMVMASVPTFVLAGRAITAWKPSWARTSAADFG